MYPDRITSSRHVLTAFCVVISHLLVLFSGQVTDGLLNSDRFNQFDWDFTKAVGSGVKDNVVISPVSIKLVLAMLYEGAQGNTSRQLEDVLQLVRESRAPTSHKFSGILNSLEAPSAEYELDIGTKLFIDKNTQLNKKYNDTLQRVFNASVHSIDFSHPGKAVKAINKWAAYVTKGHIQDLVSEADAKDTTVLLLLNVIYFKGQWQQPFPINESKPGLFRLDNTRGYQALFMNSIQNLKYTESEDLDASILRLPYMGEKFAMYIILPNEIDGLDHLMKSITPDLLHQLIATMDEVEVRVSLPKFHFDFASSLRPALEQLGLTDMFNQKANLSGIATGGKDNLMVSNVIQKAGILVNEQGSTAYVATQVDLVSKFGESTVDFRADHSFIFFIEDETTDTVVFVGKVVNPGSPGTQIVDKMKPDNNIYSNVKPAINDPQQAGAPQQEDSVIQGGNQHDNRRPSTPSQGVTGQGNFHQGTGTQQGSNQLGGAQPVDYPPTTYRPVTNQQGSFQPGNNQPGVLRPGSNQQGAFQPPSTQPAVVRPGSNQLGGFQQGNIQPGSFQPGNNQPGGFQPGNIQPGGFQPGNNQPGGFQPGNIQPGFVQPGNNQQGGFQPAISQPGVLQPNNNQQGGFQQGNNQGGTPLPAYPSFVPNNAETPTKNDNQYPGFTSTSGNSTSYEGGYFSYDGEFIKQNFDQERFSIFDTELMKTLCDSEGNANWVISSASIKTVLGMLYEGAAENTEQELANLLRLSSNKTRGLKMLHAFQRELHAIVSSDIQWKLANRLLVSNKLPILPEYRLGMSSIYHARVDQVKFDSPAQISLDINQWINNVTNGFVPTLVNPESIDRDSQMVLLNAAYFKGDWLYPFNRKFSEQNCFYPEPGRCQRVNMMNQRAFLKYGYLKALYANVLEIPYADKRFSMVIILPEGDGGIRDLVRNIPYFPLIPFLNELTPADVQLSLPSFSVKFFKDLTGPITSIDGATSIFSNKADYRHIFGQRKGKLSKIVHKAKIVVNEKGTEAGAGTAAVVVPLMISQLVTFRVNQPFLFYLRDLKTGFLFSGHIYDPSLK